MKKSLFFAAAASALMLTACSSENDVVQSAPQTQETTAQAVGFDVYMPQAVTRAGDPVGVMNTDKLKTAGKGFGVFAMYQDDAETYASSTAPNFMFNEHVHFATGWTYSPLKYWPNETIQDSQTPNAETPGTVNDPVPPATNNTYTCDKLSFFAYAPYVNLTKSVDNGMQTDRGTTPAYVNAYTEETPSTGILAITKEDRANDPLVEWKYSADLDQNVDLLWGVAPNGMAYQSVNPSIYINKTFGLPLTDMVKPDKDQKIKFLFQHALSRIGLSVVSAVDQIAAGDDGAVYNNGQTRVLIKSVEIFGDFGKQGVLNLNNTTANTANWIAASVDKASVSGSALYSFTVANGAIAKDLRYENLTTVTGAADASAAATAFGKLNSGVLPSEQPLLAQGADPSKVATDITYAYGKTLYTLSGTDYVRATTTATAAADVFTKDGSNNYTQFAKTADGAITLNGTTQYFTLTPSAKTVNKTDGDPANWTTELTNGNVYYSKTGDEATGNVIYTKFTANGSEATGTYYELEETEVAGDDYSGTCYTGLVPRYFMVIPTGATPIKVKIKYAVITSDSKLSGYCSDIENYITKESSLTLQSGKSYNLKLILGLTSVKLDATVADWQVDGSNEVWLPQNNN